MAERCADSAAGVGAITESERDNWLRHFRDEGARGPIVAGRLHLFVWGARPQE